MRCISCAPPEIDDMEALIEGVYGATVTEIVIRPVDEAETQP